MKKLCRRKTDGSWWEPSYPPGWDMGHAMTGCLLGHVEFYFRRVVWMLAPWWKFWTRGVWTRTGEIWKPASGEFDVVQLP
jgi:hypothetical protein